MLSNHSSQAPVIRSLLPHKADCSLDRWLNWPESPYIEMNFGSLKLPLFGLDLFFEDTRKFILKKKKKKRQLSCYWNKIILSLYGSYFLLKFLVFLFPHDHLEFSVLITISGHFIRFYHFITL